MISKDNKDGYVPHTIRQKVFEKYYFFKLFLNRGRSYTGQITGLFSIYALFTMYCKLYLNMTDTLLINMIALSGFLIVMGCGYMDVKRGVVKEENSFNNRWNPELQHIYKKIKAEDLK